MNVVKLMVKPVEYCGSEDKWYILKIFFKNG